VWLLLSMLRINKWPVVRATMRDPAGALPVFLFVLALAGTFWSDGSATERWQGMVPFARLLTVTIFMAQYRENDRSAQVFVAFLFSCTVLLLLSLLLDVLNLPEENPGIPVKDHISQSLEFAICAAVLIEIGISKARTAVWVALGLFIWAGVFLGDILFVATARTSLVVVLALGCVLGFRTFRWKGALIAGMLTLGALTVLAVSSPHLKDRMLSVPSELKEEGVLYPKSGSFSGKSRSASLPRRESSVT